MLILLEICSQNFRYFLRKSDLAFIIKFKLPFGDGPTIRLVIMNTGKKIRQIRLSKGYSQENLADLLSISTTAYGDIERNKTELTIARATEIAKVLEINIIDLLEIELQSVDISMEKLQLENEKLKTEVEKWQMTAAYWHEKYENRFVGNSMRVITEETERRKIGF